MQPNQFGPHFPAMPFSSSLPLRLGLSASSRLLIVFLSLTAVAATGADTDDRLCRLICVEAPSDAGGDVLTEAGVFGRLLLSKKSQNFCESCVAWPWVTNS